MKAFEYMSDWLMELAQQGPYFFTSGSVRLLSFDRVSIKGQYPVGVARPYVRFVLEVDDDSSWDDLDHARMCGYTRDDGLGKPLVPGMILYGGDGNRRIYLAVFTIPAGDLPDGLELIL